MLCKLSTQAKGSIPVGTIQGWLQIASLNHPAAKFLHHQGIWAVHEAEALHGAISMAAVVQAELEIVSAQATNLRVASYNQIEFGT
jgi:hypothetical protein